MKDETRQKVIELAESLGTHFGPYDWVIVAVYLAGTVAIGLYVNRYIRSMADYVVAGRSLKSFIAIASMIGTELGLITVMYAAQKGFSGGFAAFHIGLVAGIVALIVGLTGFIVVPLRQMGVMTIPEFYEKRFGRGVRIFGGLLLAGGGILNMGMFLKAGQIFVTGLTGLHAEIYVNIVMTVLITLVLAYTILGGMVSVVITDFIQFFVLSFGMLLACALAVGHLGWENIVETVTTIHGEKGFNPFDTKGFGPSYIVWQIFVAGLVSCAVWQTAVMRACAAESTRVVKRLYAWSSIGFTIRFVIPQFLGICALVYFYQHPEGQAVFFPGGEPSGEEALTLHAMPMFLSQVLPAGLIGLVGAGMLAAFMSTHDSYLLCWSSVLVQDVINPASGYRLTTKTRLAIARVLIFLIGVFLLVWSLWYPLKQDLWEYMAVSGGIYYVGAFVLLLGGLYWKRASRVGAYLALVCGSFAVLGLGQPRAWLSDVLTRALSVVSETSCEVVVREQHVVLGVTLAATLAMALGSCLFPDQDAPREPDPQEE